MFDSLYSDPSTPASQDVGVFRMNRGADGLFGKSHRGSIAVQASVDFARLPLSESVDVQDHLQRQMSSTSDTGSDLAICPSAPSNFTKRPGQPSPAYGTQAASFAWAKLTVGPMPQAAAGPHLSTRHRVTPEKVQPWWCCKAAEDFLMRTTTSICVTTMPAGGGGSLSRTIERGTISITSCSSSE